MLTDGAFTIGSGELPNFKTTLLVKSEPDPVIVIAVPPVVGPAEGDAVAGSGADGWKLHPTKANIAITASNRNGVSSTNASIMTISPSGLQAG
jgi:hypothetical protein